MECHNFEECEFNGGPECRLPDGMKCPHGVKADKPAAESGTDIEQLIERLNQYSQTLIAYQMGGEFADVCMDVATALSTLQAENAEMQKQLNEFSEFLCHIIGEMSSENEKLRAELKSKVDLVFQQTKELDRRNLLLREQEAELEQVKKCIEIAEFQRDAAIKDLSEIIGDIEKIRCEYDIHNSDADDAYMNLCGIYCANEGYICYKEDENYRCKNFEWRGPQKENI